MAADISASGPSASSRNSAWRRQVFQRRRKMLYAFMLFACTGILLIYLLILYTDLGTNIPVDNLSRLQNATFVTLLGAAACYLIARRGFVNFAACLFLGVTLLVATFLDDPLQVIGGRSMISFPILIVFAGLLLPPYGAFVFAGIATLAIAGLAFTSGANYVPVVSDAIIFFLVAATTWYYASRLERANQDLAASRAALEDLNAVLEQRIDERTAELRQANAQLAQSNRLKDEFLATMSHELRTPLASVLMVADALDEGLYGSLTPAQSKKMRQLSASGQRLLKLIQQVLDYAQIEAGGLHVALRRIPVLPLCQEVVQEMAPGVEARQQSLQLRCELEAGACVTADPHCLREILLTLLDNASKFTPDAGQIGLDVLPGPQAGSVQFVVWDTGIGIAAADLPVVFQPFHQVDARLSRGYEGAGLSLALAWRLAAVQSGSLHAASTPGEGSRFTLALPGGG